MKKNARLTITSFLLLLLFTVSWTLCACAQIRDNSATNKSNKLAEQKPKTQDDPIPQEPIGTSKGRIFVAYPRGENNNKIQSASTFIVGAIPPSSSLSCNGQPVNSNESGYFSHVVKLGYGKNNFKLVLSGQENEPMEIIVERPSPPAILASASFNILPESLEPKESLGVSLGDTIQLAARGTPGHQMYAQIGSKQINLKPALSPRKDGKGPSVNLGLDTAFGVSFQKSPAALKDLYIGFYKIGPDDKWAGIHPTFVLAAGKKLVKAKAKGAISVIQQPILLETTHANTIVRVSPGAARLTPLPESIRLIADGYKNEWWRLSLSPTQHAWISKEDLHTDNESSVLPLSKVDTINLGTDNYGARIAIPLNQRLPYQIEQDLHNKKVVLRIFGATANTDFVTADLHPQDSGSAKIIDHISFKQKEDLHYELSAHLLNKEQWGYWASYEDNTLVLHIKSQPNVDTSSGTLNGVIICVDPGHGGKEPGSIGCSGIKEATLNFAIADKLRKELELMGAKVIMTRTGEKFVSLQERVDIAVAAHADMLISVHNNALPDGRDPLLEHGTSSYWYHTQSLEFARLAQKQLSSSISFKDYGCRYQNLALCRPSNMIAVLMEIGFMINPDEFSKLTNPTSQEQAAKSIAGSVKQYIYTKLSAESAKVH